jgi:hypothetical protein
MQPTGSTDLIPFIRDVLQILSSFAVIVVACLAALGLRGAWRVGNRIQLDIDMQVLESGGEPVGELVITLQNMGNRQQRIHNLFLEVRPSRHTGNGGGPALVPAVNFLGDEDLPLVLAPGVRQVLTWSFEVPRDERLLRVTAAMNTAGRMDGEAVPSLSQKNLWLFGKTARYTSRLFEVAPGGFGRF